MICTSVPVLGTAPPVGTGTADPTLQVHLLRQTTVLDGAGNLVMEFRSEVKVVPKMVNWYIGTITETAQPLTC